MTDIQKTLSDRREKYGDFREHARISTDLKRAMRQSANWDTLPPYMEEALDMIQHKIARILNGDPTYTDSWCDLVGYSQLAYDRLKADNLSREIRQAFDEVTTPLDHEGKPDIKPTTVDPSAW